MVRTVQEERPTEDVPCWSHPEWRDRFLWLVQGTTGRGEEGDFDLGLFGALAVGQAMQRWTLLRERTRMATAVHSRQIHEAQIDTWTTPLPRGLLVTDGQDAHVATVPDVLLTVSVADCVPVFVVDAEHRAVAMIHAGWRSVVANVVERSIAALRDVARSELESLWLHCGPSICGRCYEVGAEVHQGVNPEREPPEGPTPIDLRAAIAARAVSIGLRSEQLTISAHCTKCGPGAFFSHRGGAPERQLGILGVRS